MSKITVTTIAGATSGADANKVKIESGDELNVVNGDLTVDTNTLKVDSSNNRVGIGTSSPSSRLHLKGDAYTPITIDGTSGGTIDFYRNGSRHAQIFTDNAGGDIVFRNNTTTEKLRILSSGGITFNGDTAAANALDDYEEGTWTPTYTSSSTDPTFTPNLQDGLYTKIGRVVYASFRLRGAISGTKTGNLRLSGLPFTSNSSSANGSGGIGLTEAFGADNYPTNLRVNQISTYINLQVYDSADPRDGLFTNVTVTSTSGSSSGNYIIGHVVYQTD